MLAELKKVRFPVETGLLIAFCIFLPLVEVPKNIAWFGYVSAWLLNRARARDFGGRWDGWDTLFACWIASGYLSSAFAGLHGKELGAAHELARYAILGWLVRRGGYSVRELGWIFAALIASTAVGLVEGYWQLWSNPRRQYLQLNSVGHVNHTAIYLAIMLGVAASWLFARWRAWSAGMRVVGLAMTAAVLVSLVVTQSRGAIGAGVGLLVLLAAAWWPRWRAPLAASLACIVLGGALLVAMDAGVVRKQKYYAETHQVLSLRDGIWRTALAAWERYPWFGVGMDNYSKITEDKVREWRAQAGKDFDPGRYLRNPHAHNLFLNTLAERGLVGFAALAAVLLAWLASLLRHRPRPAESDFLWLSWGASAGAWLATCGIGLVNTTLHHEHGLLAALLLGQWLWMARARPAS